MKYKLRGDYCFKTDKNEILRNKRDKDGNVTEPVIIDSNVHEKAIAEQLHMLEAVVEKKPVVNPPEVDKKTADNNPPEGDNDKQPDNPKQDDNGQQSLSLSSSSGTGKKGK